MSLVQTENLNVAAFDHMPSPDEIKARVPLTDRAAKVVVAGRQRPDRTSWTVKDPRLFSWSWVPAPSTIPVAGLDYAAASRP
jgi:3-deoxy-7-phosphoheptulonate synthase